VVDATVERSAERAAARGHARELYALTGERPSVTWTRGGAVKVSVRVRGRHDEVLARAVLDVLGRGDRFGHRKTERRAYLWLEVGGVPTVNEEWR